MIDNINHSTRHAVLGIAKASTDMNVTANMVTLVPLRTHTAYGVRVASVCNPHPSGGREASMHLAPDKAMNHPDNLRLIARLNTRQKFLQEHVPNDSDLDIKAMQSAFLGLVWRLSEDLS